MHVLTALSVSVASLAFAVYLLWPHSQSTWVGPASVQAAGGERVEIAAVPPRGELPQDPGRVALTPNATGEAGASGEDVESVDAASLLCSVVDESWRPVPGAEVWIDEGLWRRAGESDVRGECSLTFDAEAWSRRFDAGRGVQIGARSSSHGPSLVTTLYAPPDAPLTLVLRGRGAELSLDVSDTLGRPVAGAAISFHDELLPQTSSSLAVLDGSGRYRRPTPVPPATTDAWGRAQLFGLEPGARQLTITRDGFCTLHLTLSLLEGEQLRERVQLERAAGIRGRVRRTDGGSLEGLRITGVGLDPRSEVSSEGNQDGTYELSGLPAGPVSLFAELVVDGRVTHAARAQTRLEPGAWWTWNPSLQPVDLISGRLVDAWDGALQGWRVELRAGEESGEFVAITDETGEYDLPRPRKYIGAQLWFYHPEAEGGLPSRIVQLDDPGDQVPTVDLEEGLELASRFRGRLLKPNGQPPSGQTIALHRLIDHTVLALMPDPDTGYFETPALPPGEYMIVLPHHGRGWTPDQLFVLDGQNVSDMGVLVLPKNGKLSIYTEFADRRADCLNMRMELLRPGIAAGAGLPVLVGLAEVPQQFVLAPGNYRLELPDSKQQSPIEFTIESGQTTHVVLQGTE